MVFLLIAETKIHETTWGFFFFGATSGYKLFCFFYTRKSNIIYITFEVVPPSMGTRRSFHHVFTMA